MTALAGHPQSNGSSRPSKVVLGEALDELREREQRLIQFEAELKEVRAAIKLLDRAMGDGKHPRPTAQNPAGDTKRAILDLLTNSLEPMTLEEIAEGIGREPAGWLSMLVKKQVGSGALVAIGDRYGVASPINAEEAA